jgi:hypothetical protein
MTFFWGQILNPTMTCFLGRKEKVTFQGCLNSAITDWSKKMCSIWMFEKGICRFVS